MSHEPTPAAAVAETTQPLRVLMLSDFYAPVIGGLERHVQTLAHALVRRGHHVAVATQRHPDAADFELDGAVPIHRMQGWNQALAAAYMSVERPFHPTAPDPGLMAALRRVIATERPDVIHAHGWALYSYLALKRRLGIPLVVSLHDYGLVCPKKSYLHQGSECSGPAYPKCVPCASGQYGFAKSLAVTTGLHASRRLHARVDRFIAVSQSVARASWRGTRQPPAATQVIPNFLADTAEESGRAVARPSFLPKRDGYLLFVGALAGHKGLNVLLRAHAVMRQRVPLVLIGTPQHDTPAGFPADVVVARDVPHDQVMAAWQRCAVGVVPSLWPEPCATTVLEAMACGRPVVASDTGGLPEVVEDGLTGLVVPPARPEPLAAALDRLVADVGLRERMGQAARERVRGYTDSAVSERIERVYRDVVRPPTTAGVARTGGARAASRQPAVWRGAVPTAYEPAQTQPKTDA